MRPGRIVSWLVSAAITLVAWMSIAPANLGGSLSYVTIKGTSMNPGIHAGDLVVLKPSPPYRVGDVVAYRSNLSAAPILHRVIDVTGDRFLMQGDNNDFVDYYRPTEADIIGQKVFLVPNGVAVVEFATQVWFIVAVGVLFLAFTLVLILRAERQRRRGGRTRNARNTRNRRGGRRPPQLPDPPHDDEPAEPALEPVGAAVSAPSPTTPTEAATHRRRDHSTSHVLRVPGKPMVWLLFAALFAGMSQVAWTSPLHTDAAQTRPLLAKFHFDYGAELPPNPVYEEPTLHFGDTVFLSVVDRVDVSVGWTLPAAEVFVAGGALELRIVLTSTAGWTRELGAPVTQPITGPEATAVVPVDFTAARLLAHEVDQAAGVSGRVTVDVIATADVDGVTTATGKPGPLTERTSSILSFSLTDNTAALTENPSGASQGNNSKSSSSPTGSRTAAGRGMAAQASSSSGGSNPTPEAVLEPGVREVVQWVQTAQLVPNQISFGPLSLDVGVARNGSTAGLVLFLGLGLGGLAIEYLARHRGEPAYIAALHGARLVPMRDLPDTRMHDVVDLASFDALLAMSRRLDLPIMIETPGRGTDRRGTVRYYVYDGPATYRYVTTLTTKVADMRSADDEAGMADAGEDTDDAAGDDHTDDAPVGTGRA